MEKRDSPQEIIEDHTKKDLKRTAENALAHHAPVEEGVIHAPLVRASSLPAQLTDEVVSADSEAKRRRMRRKNNAHVTFVENEDSKAHDGSSSARGSNNPNLQITEGQRGEANRNAVAAAASQGRPPRSPIGPPPAQRVKPDSMPYVYTTGPSGRRVYGFLYRFWAPVAKIMCVCHGEFFTPGQFVEHGGGSVVENPNRHNILTPFPFHC